MNKIEAQKLLKMEEEIKEILDFEEYGIFEEKDFSIEYEDDYEAYTIKLKIGEKDFEFMIRFKDGEEVDLDEDDVNVNVIEYHVLEDIWIDITSYDYRAKYLLLMLLFDACSKN